MGKIGTEFYKYNQRVNVLFGERRSSSAVSKRMIWRHFTVYDQQCDDKTLVVLSL